MPRRMTHTRQGTHQTLKNMSFEKTLVGWLMADGWQVFIPVLDNGHCTDILISDGPNFYRIQVKTVADNSSQVVYNQWLDKEVDVVVYFARTSNWGVIAPAFEEKKRSLDHPEHRKFVQSRKNFLKEFHQF
ncbi:hypothetical protein V5J35_000585 [Endozoicomonas sp. NE40]|uniref:PD(D/E)XK endonuclease domain-containing protein n=2 Tax=Endozoicomonas lisbonensis TaxID=3120522 RepID=A0ABV2SCA3_9GAMM